MADDKAILDAIHINVHALRLIKGYKPSDFEVRIAKIITDRYHTTCNDCNQSFIRNQNQPQTQPKSKFWAILTGE